MCHKMSLSLLRTHGKTGHAKFFYVFKPISREYTNTLETTFLSFPSTQILIKNNIVPNVQTNTELIWPYIHTQIHQIKPNMFEVACQTKNKCPPNNGKSRQRLNGTGIGTNIMYNTSH